MRQGGSAETVAAAVAAVAEQNRPALPTAAGAAARHANAAAPLLVTAAAAAWCTCARMSSAVRRMVEELTLPRSHKAQRVYKKQTQRKIRTEPPRKTDAARAITT
jgi:hypothetical protein